MWFSSLKSEPQSGNTEKLTNPAYMWSTFFFLGGGGGGWAVVVYLQQFLNTESMGTKLLLEKEGRNQLNCNSHHLPKS